MASTIHCGNREPTLLFLDCQQYTQAPLVNIRGRNHLLMSVDMSQSPLHRYHHIVMCVYVCANEGQDVTVAEVVKL